MSFPSGRRLALLLLVILALPGCRLSKNFYEIDPGKYYRSAQLTGEELAEACDHYGIKTLINLRGAHPDEDWYQDEVAATQRAGVQLIDIPMSADHIPHRWTLVALLDAFRDGERPLLVHCKAGADRTGEASAIYQLEYMGKTREEALAMVDWDYWHVAFFKPAKSYFIREVYQGEAWAREVYDPCAPDQHYDHYGHEERCRASHQLTGPPEDQP